MRIGIIAERRIKSRNPFKRYQSEIIYNEKNPFELIIIRIPFTAKNLDKTPSRRIKKAVLKASEILKASGADKITVVSLLKKHLTIPDNSRQQAFFTIIPHCIRSIAPKCGIHPPDCRICIRATKMDRITEYLAGELCYDTKKLILSISDSSDSARFQERFYNETGFFAEIIHTITTDADILIDLTQPSVRIGRDILIDGAELDFDLGDCDVDCLEVAAGIDGFDTSKKISAYMMGKKKLTL